MGAAAGSGGAGAPGEHAGTSAASDEAIVHRLVIRVGRPLVPLALLWGLLVAAAPQPAPVELPPPDLTALVSIAAGPLDKPPVPVPEPSMPDSPYTLPTLPPPPLILDPVVAKPVYPTRPAECTAWQANLGFASAIIDCGRVRYETGEYDRAIEMFEEALNKRPSREDTRKAHYWLGEALYERDRLVEADREFEKAYREGPRDDFAAYALHSSGWTALRLGDTSRALDAFEGVLKLQHTAVTQSLVVPARRGRALALSFLGRHEDARQAWAKLLDSTPQSLAREAMFWLGESLGRLGQFDPADEQLTRFAAGGPHPLLETGLLRLGWWRNAAGHPAEAAKAYRQALASKGGFPERDWASFGYTMALISAGDLTGARDAVKPLQERSSPLAMPALFTLATVAGVKNPAVAHALNQDLLSSGLIARDRAWILLLEGEIFRLEGKKDDARTRYDLARMADPVGRFGWFARLRLGQTNFEFREFAQVQADVTALLNQPIPSELQAPALLLTGESAYYAANYDASVSAFRRFLNEYGSHPSGPVVTISIGWAELRRGNEAEARRIFTDFARDLPDNSLAPDALLLAAELAANGGDGPTALALLDRMEQKYPTHPRADIARLNEAILLLRAGQAAEAQPLLQNFVSRTPTSPLIGRARVALGAVLLITRNPQRAYEEFAAARREGEGALARLGVGVASLSLQRWEDATTNFTAARDSGTPVIVNAAEYGLAVAAFGRGDRDGFKEVMRMLMGTGRATPGLMYALVVFAIDAKAWDEALDSAKRLVKQFPSDISADSSLARVGLAAAEAGSWPTANEAITSLRQQYAQSPLLDLVFMRGVEAQIATGATDQARKALETFVGGASDDPRLPRAWFLLAGLREDAGDRAGAITAYLRSRDSGATAEWTTVARLRFARLLLDEKRWKEARADLDVVMKGEDVAAAAEAAFYQGESFRAEANASAAVEFYMTAAYLEPSSIFGRRALLAAAQSYTNLKQPDLAAIAYQKLLAQPDLPAELALSARSGLDSLGPR